MATAYFFGSYPPTRGLSPFNPYIKNIELKSLFHPRFRNNTGKPSKPSDHSEVLKQYGQTIKILRSFRGLEAIRVKQSFRGPKAIRAKRQNPHFIRGPETGIQSPGTLPIFPYRGFL